MSFARFSTNDFAGEIRGYVGEGEFTDDPLNTFGGAGVVEIPKLQKLLRYICENGFEHHVAANFSHTAASSTRPPASTSAGRCTGTNRLFTHGPYLFPLVAKALSPPQMLTLGYKIFRDGLTPVAEYSLNKPFQQQTHNLRMNKSRRLLGITTAAPYAIAARWL